MSGGEGRAYKVLVGNPAGKRPLRRPNVDGKLNLEVGWKIQNALCGSERRQCSGGLLWTRQWSFDPQKLQLIFWLA